MPLGQGLVRNQPIYRIHIDLWLLLALGLVVSFGLIMLYSAVDKNPVLFTAQLLRVGAGFAILFIIAHVPPRYYFRWSPFLYAIVLLMLVAVLFVGVTAKGSQRWLNLPGLPRFQPSEMMKVAVPLMVAWFLNDRPLPPRLRHLAWALLMILVPAVLVGLQPDLGTAILIITAGLGVIFLSGIYWRWLGYASLAVALSLPALWFVMQGYQKERVLTLFDPERDPLGAGWNIIQSKTAIGSGGLYGKGLFAGTQSHLEFLPESHTDFIIAVIGEELGFFGIAALLLLYLCVIVRCLYMSSQMQDTFGRLVIGGLTLTFFVYLFVNIAMVIGLLPVVGVPLPLISYGGTSVITLLASFGIIMSIYTHRRR
ncbi:MAG: rod shape-determining protein RodA [Pseudomonadales bacterium]|nr:rod shape-determining protein RodA [Pseudomonadales bacterium]